MAGLGPAILIVAPQQTECDQITLPLGEAGFRVIAAPAGDAAAAIDDCRPAAAVLALPGRRGVGLLQRLRAERQPLRALVILDRTAPAFAADADVQTSVILRPFDPRRMLGCVFELVLRDPGRGTASAMLQTCRLAELGIAAARLACLYNRQAIAAAAGAGRVVAALEGQIRDAESAHRALARAAAGSNPPAVRPLQLQLDHLQDISGAVPAA